MSSTDRSYLVGLIGAGVGPSLSPALHERAAQRRGMRYVYRSIDIGADGPGAVGPLLDSARRLGFDALNITHPCKQAVIACLDRLSPDAVRTGAVNTVLFAAGEAVGHNTDLAGFARSFARGLPGARLDRVAVLGAGGAGSAIAHALLDLGAGHLRIVDTDAARATAAAAALRARGASAEPAAPADLPALLATVDGLVNATPVGMAEHPGSPVAAELLAPRLWVADAVYRPADTALLRGAGERGCRILPGTGMALYQAAAAFRLITGHEPDTAGMADDMAALAPLPAG
ncbi:shikimate dehydrogenase [Nocardiopsis coralliicola]